MFLWWPTMGGSTTFLTDWFLQVLVFSFMSNQYGRILQVVFNGTEVDIWMTPLFDFQTPETAEPNFQIFLQYMAGRPIGTTTEMLSVPVEWFRLSLGGWWWNLLLNHSGCNFRLICGNVSNTIYSHIACTSKAHEANVNHHYASRVFCQQHTPSQKTLLGHPILKYFSIETSLDYPLAPWYSP